MMSTQMKLKFSEKIGYALGDTAANLAWRSITTFLLVFYTDVFGISAAAAGLLLLITRLSDGITDVIMGIIADRTNTRFGKFRPYILFTAIPFGVIMVLTFTTPNFGNAGKLVWAYSTYILLTLIYTANNVPYSALMGVMTDDHLERTSLSSFRFAGAYFGGIITQGGLLWLVLWIGQGDKNTGYQYTMYLFAALLIVFFLITFYATKERVKPKPESHSNIWSDLKDLVTNKPWIILLFVGFLFVIFNSIKQGITVIYFKRYLGNELLASSYMVVLLVISMVAAIATMPLAKYFGKKNLFMLAMLFAGLTNSIIYFVSPDNVILIYVLGSLSEFGAGIMPVLFFSMLGDAADFSEYTNQRRATGLIYSAGTFAMKFGGGVAGAVIGFVLARYGYEGMVETTVSSALIGIKVLMSWIPAIFIALAVAVMAMYPLTKSRMNEIEGELRKIREQ